MSSGPVSSPCVSVCALDERDICIGCHRTGEEISQWWSMTDDERRAVMKQVAARERVAYIGQAGGDR
ncbi:DUF1289 domain-containing protein [Mangrovitalea sediminis]|uniref:DUF1289 domain-containing protein n=1 Tax=Mangrovitalea sediminis TaxID=1982043 RepID=UPI000BE60EC3|nr:DUF1289 domain-containing protein [Mangrovitalea sediminis]